jgi:hypothetical protein
MRAAVTKVASDDLPGQEGRGSVGNRASAAKFVGVLGLAIWTLPADLLRELSRSIRRLPNGR